MYNGGMTREELEAEDLSEEENAQLWAEEAERRDADLDVHPGSGRPADEVLRDARSRQLTGHCREGEERPCRK